MNRYYGYGFQIHSNVPLPGLKEQRPEAYEECYTVVDISVSVEACMDSENTPYGIVPEGRGYTLYLQDMVYRIERTGITAVTKYPELFYSTLFNVPMSVLMLLHGRLLLHSSAFVHNGLLFPVCARKGTGKSTLIAYAVKQGTLCFCDDTLPLLLCDSKLIAVKGAEWIKMDKNTCDMLQYGAFGEYRKNWNQKAYVPAESHGSSASVERLFYLFYGEKGNVLYPVHSNIYARSLIFENIVGVAWFEDTLLKAVKHNEIFRFLCEHGMHYVIKSEKQWGRLEDIYGRMIKECSDFFIC